METLGLLSASQGGVEEKSKVIKVEKKRGRQAKLRGESKGEDKIVVLNGSVEEKKLDGCER